MRQQAAQGHENPESLHAATEKTPLVSVLIPTHNRPDYFELALKSVLAQGYPNIEIVVSDNSDDESTQQRIRPYLARHEQIIYSRVPGYSALENFTNCDELARGEYINYLMDDDLFHPDKIGRMMHFMLNQPGVGLVTSFRQLIDGDGHPMKPLPGTERLFDVETRIGGISLGNKMLSDGHNMVGEPTTVLFRKSDASPDFGVFHGRQYGVISDVATWLSVLSHSDCIYLPEALSYFRIHGGQDQQSGNAIRIRANIEWLQLFCDAWHGGRFMQHEGPAQELLSSKLVTCVWYLTSVRAAIRQGNFDLEKIQSVINQAMAILLRDKSSEMPPALNQLVG